MFRLSLLCQSSRQAKDRMSSAEKKALDISYEDMWQDFRQAAEAHRQTRKYMKEFIQPGKTMIDIWLVLLILISYHFNFSSCFKRRYHLTMQVCFAVY